MQIKDTAVIILKMIKDRKANRKTDYDYSTAGHYFVTICTKDRINYFGQVINQCPMLSRLGNMVYDCWQDIPNHFSYAQLGEFVVMPNHLHGIVTIQRVGNADLHSLRESGHLKLPDTPNYDRTKMKLSKIIHGFKSSVTRHIHQQFHNQEFAWQKSFHDRIIRNEEEYENIAMYIQQNPANW